MAYSSRHKNRDIIKKITAIPIVTEMLRGMLPAVVFAKDAASYDQYANAYAIMYNGDDDLLTPDLKDTSNSGLKGDGAISMKGPSSLKRLAASAE